VTIYPLQKAISETDEPTNSLTPGTPFPGVHHYTNPFALPIAIIPLDLFCFITVYGFLAT
jgi:hypothetical protein